MEDGKITKAALERFANYVEEVGETLQAMGKIIRFGNESKHPSGKGPTNKDHFSSEVGNLKATIALMEEAGDINKTLVKEGEITKINKLNFYSFYQSKEMLDSVSKLLTGDKP